MWQGLPPPRTQPRMMPDGTESTIDGNNYDA